MSEIKKTNWIHSINDRVNNLAEEFGLNDTQTNRFRDFTFEMAREQYKVGNKSGIAWIYKQIREKSVEKIAGTV